MDETNDWQSHESITETATLTDDQRRRWYTFVIITLIAVIVILVGSIIRMLHVEHPIDNVWTWAKLPQWCAFLGTLTGAYGATQPPGVKPKSKLRDYFSLVGWVILLYGAAIALLYVK